MATYNKLYESWLRGTNTIPATYGNVSLYTTGKSDLAGGLTTTNLAINKNITANALDVSGNVVFSSLPTCSAVVDSSNQLTTKLYVDNAISGSTPTGVAFLDLSNNFTKQNTFTGDLVPTRGINASSTSIGLNALRYRQATSLRNIGIGTTALQGNTTTPALNTGLQNIGIGENALKLVEDASNNVVIGHNTCIGVKNNIRFNDNVVIGNDAFNTAVVSTGNTTECVFIGNRVGQKMSSTTGNSRANVGIGTGVMANHIGGGGNTVIGFGASNLATGGSATTAIGFEALGSANSIQQITAVGGAAGKFNTSLYNTFLGNSTGQQVAGTNFLRGANTFIGHAADLSPSLSSSANIHNHTALGFKSLITQNYPSIVLGGRSDYGLPEVCIPAKNKIYCCSTFSSASNAMMDQNPSQINHQYGDTILLTSAVSSITLPRTRNITEFNTDTAAGIPASIGARYTFVKNYVSPLTSVSITPFNAFERILDINTGTMLSSITMGSNIRSLSLVNVGYVLNPSTAYVSWVCYSRDIDTSAFISTSSNNAFTGTNSFSILPTCNAVVDTSNQLVNKTYVDNAIAGSVPSGVAFLDLSNNFTQQNTFSGITRFYGDASFNNPVHLYGGLYAGHAGMTINFGTNAPTMNGTNIHAETIPDGALTTNIPKKNGNSHFTGHNTHSGITTFNADGSFNLLCDISANGVLISPTELSYLNNVSSNIQTQLNGKQATGNYATTDTTQTISGNTTFSGITSFTNDISVNSVLISPTELSYLNNVSSNIQTQLDGKQATGNYATTDTTQTISGLKTFSTCPQSTIDPVNNDDLVRKTWVNTNVGTLGCSAIRFSGGSVQTNGGIYFPSTNLYRKIVLYANPLGTGNNEFQNYSIGANNTDLEMMFLVPDNTRSFKFSHGTSTTAKQDILRIASTGLTLSQGTLTLPSNSISDSALSSNVMLETAANSMTGSITLRNGTQDNINIEPVGGIRLYNGTPFVLYTGTTTASPEFFSLDYASSGMNFYGTECNYIDTNFYIKNSIGTIHGTWNTTALDLSGCLLRVEQMNVAHAGTGSITGAITISKPFNQYYAVESTSTAYTITLPTITEKEMGKEIIFRKVKQGASPQTISFIGNGTQKVYNTELVGGATAQGLMTSSVYVVKLVALLDSTTGGAYGWFQSSSFGNLATTDTAQTISALKTFSICPQSTASVVNSNDLTRKAYVDNQFNLAVPVAGDKTITGTKTFNSPPIFRAAAIGGDNVMARCQNSAGNERILFRDEGGAYPSTGPCSIRSPASLGMSVVAEAGTLYCFSQSTQFGVGLTAAATSWVQASDIRLKHKISNIENELDNICKLRPVYYNFKGDTDDFKPRVGFIAQEVEQIYPNLINDLGYRTEIEDNVKALSIETLVPYMVKAIQEQQQTITNLSNELSELKNILKSKNII